MWLLLLACRPDDAPKPADPRDTADTAAPDTPGDSVDSAPPDTATGPDDTADDSGDTTTDTRTHYSSDDAAPLGDCASATPICTAGACSVDVDLTTVTVSGAFPARAHGDWALRFADTRVDIDNGNPIEGSGYGLLTDFGTFATWPAGPSYAVRAFTGTYDVALDYGDDFNYTQHYPIATGLTLSADTTLDVDPAFHAVSGTLSVGGEPINGEWTLHFREPGGGWAEFRGTGPTFDVDLPDGDWTVTFKAEDSGQLAAGRFDAGSVTVPGADTTVNLAIAAERVTGALTYAGMPLDPDPYSPYTVRFFDADGAEWSMQWSAEHDFSTYLPSGTYQVVLDELDAVVGQDLVVSGETRMDLADETVTVTGTLSIDGATPDDTWSVTLKDPVTGVEYWTTGPAWSLGVHAGTWDVYVQQRANNWTSTARVAAGVTIATDTTLDVPVHLARLRGEATWNGDVPPTGWRVWLFDAETRDRVVTVEGAGTNWWVDVPTGTYDVYVERPLSLVDQYVAVARGLTLAEGREDLVLDARTYTVDGTVRIDGAASATGGILAHEHGADTIAVFEGTPAAWSVDLPAGTYTFLGRFPDVVTDGTTELPLAICSAVGPS